MTVFRSLLAASALVTATPAHSVVHEPALKTPKPLFNQVSRSLMGDGLQREEEWNGPSLPDVVPAPRNKASPSGVPPCYGSSEGKPVRCAAVER